MTVSLRKGGNVSLDKVAPSLKMARLELLWKERATDGEEFDLDASLFLTNASGLCASNEDFIFYNNKRSKDGSVVHAGDNLTGGGEGEKVYVELQKVPTTIAKIVAVITIHEAVERNQTFGDVVGAGVRLVNDDTGEVVATFDLTEDYSVETAMVMCELYRHNGEWKFRAVGQGFAGGLQAACKTHDIDAA